MNNKVQHQHIPHSYIAIVIGPCNSIQLGTLCLLFPASRDDNWTDISSFFVEFYIENFGDIIDNIHLFDEEDPSSIVAREHSDPLVHSLHDQSYKVDMIVDPYVQYF